MASSMATLDLARQRTEMEKETLASAPRYPTGKRKATRPSRVASEPQPKQPRRPRRWRPPGWDGVPWTARSVHPGGLESNHEPNMTSFRPTVRDSDGPSSSRLSWLRPHNRVSIWEHLAEVERQAGTVAASPAVVMSGTSTLSSSGAVRSASVVDTMKALQGSVAREAFADTAENELVKGTAQRLSAAGCSIGPSSYVAVPPAGRPTWAVPSFGLAVAVSDSPSSTLCAVSSSTVEVDDPTAPAVTTPAATCPADRVSIESLVNKT